MTTFNYDTKELTVTDCRRSTHYTHRWAFDLLKEHDKDNFDHGYALETDRINGLVAIMQRLDTYPQAVKFTIAQTIIADQLTMKE